MRMRGGGAECFCGGTGGRQGRGKQDYHSRRILALGVGWLELRLKFCATENRQRHHRYVLVPLFFPSR